MKNTEVRKRQICRRFAALHKEKFKCNYDDLIAGKYGQPVQSRLVPKEFCINIHKDKTLTGRAFFFYFEPVQEKKAGGQPLLFSDERRVDVALRLPLWIKEKLKSQQGTLSAQIETAIVSHYKLKKGE